MRYDVVFLRREPGQSWDEAFAERQTQVEDTGAAIRKLGPAEIEAWDRIVARTREALGEVEATTTAIVGELVHAPTGIEISVSAGEAGITVPYRHSGDAALEVMSQVYALAHIVEDETGFEGYDIQLEEPVSDARRRSAPSRAPAAPRDDGSDDERDGSGPVPGPLGSRPARPPLTEPDVRAAAAPTDPRRHWWEFWRR